MDKKSIKYFVFGGGVIIVCIISILHFIEPRDLLTEIEEGNYSCINDDEIQRQLQRIFSLPDFNVRWTYEDINQDGTEDLILEELTNTAARIIGIFTTEGQDVEVVLWDDAEMTSYYERCDSGILCYTQYYGIYDNERYELYSYDYTWKKIFIKGLELYDIEDAPPMQLMDSSLRLDKTGVHYLEFFIHDEKEQYRELTEEEWRQAFSALFGKEYSGDILE